MRVRNGLYKKANVYSLKVESGAALEPLLVDGLRNPVVAAWDPVGVTVDQHWYIVPSGVNWESLVAWLFDRGIRAYVPAAASRTPALAVLDDRLRTAKERNAIADLDRFEQEVTARRGGLQSAIQQVTNEADTIRRPLLYESGEPFKEAVAAILFSCHFNVEDLDETFGAGRSGDLLASRNGHHWLIESKGLMGAPKEADVADVVKHRETWRKLGRTEELEGCILILNHHVRMPPAGRPRSPYERPEFVAALEGFGVTVIDSVALGQWWSAEECERVIDAITGPPKQHSRDE